MEINEEIMKMIPPETPEDNELAEMIWQAKTKELNHCFGNIETVKHLFGPRAKWAKAVKKYGDKAIICEIITATQKAKVLLTYERVWAYDPDDDTYVFTTELV